MPVVILLTAFCFVLLLLGGVMHKGYGLSLSTLRSWVEDRGMEPKAVARLTGIVCVAAALMMQAAALLFAYAAGDFELVLKDAAAAALLALIALLLLRRVPPKADM